LHYGIEPGGKLRPQRRRARRRVDEVGPHLGVIAIALERHVAGQHEVEDAAERVHVGARVDALAADLLRRDVVQRADPLLGLRRSRAAERVLGEPEVAQVHMADSVHHHVLRLDVAVYVARAVDRIERVAELQRDVRRLTSGERSRAVDERAQVVAGDVPHHEVSAPVRDPGAMDRDDVRVLDGAGRARLGEEALPAMRVLYQLRSDDLDGHVAIEVQLANAIDDPHPAPSDDRLDTATSEHRARVQHAHGACITKRSAPQAVWAILNHWGSAGMTCRADVVRHALHMPWAVGGAGRSRICRRSVLVVDDRGNGRRSGSA